MIINILIGVLIFGYAGWTMWKFINKSKQGKCAACELKKGCAEKTSVCSTSGIADHK
ncbi:FeoB-associated Cys-rich membrane protein [Bacillus benzoevorans]|nr:FeoB-associated Cys-rich membrane protein [Bacillus benzoevorans]